MSGERMVRIGDVTYDGGGNVIVDIVTVQGISVRHVLVDGKTHQIAAARSRRGNVG
jgi:uncharacterized protein YegL